MGNEQRTPPKERRQRRRRLLEFGKNTLIVLLVLNAVYLTGRSQMGTLETAAGGLWGTVRNFLGRGGSESPSAERPEGQIAQLRPLRMAVNLAGVGTYGVQYDSAASDKLFDRVFTLLGESLGSAEAPLVISRRAWQEALTQRDSIYFDFATDVPLTTLYLWTGAVPDAPPAGESARRLLLAEDDGGAITFYYQNEAEDTFYACATAESLRGHLKAVAQEYEAAVNGVTFAFQTPESTLGDYVMLPKTSAGVTWPVYQVANPLGGGSREETRKGLIAALDFHPQANTSYVTAGKQVVREGPDTLSVHDSGAVDYHSVSAEEPKYPVGDGIHPPTESELLAATAPLVEASVGAYCGEERLVRPYLRGITDLGEGVWQVEYGYLLSGAVVQLGAEGYAARFLVSEGRVSDFYLMLRTYTATDQRRSVLPEAQAEAAMGALGAEGRELVLSYEDSGKTDTVYPGWIAE